MFCKELKDEIDFLMNPELLKYIDENELKQESLSAIEKLSLSMLSINEEDDWLFVKQKIVKEKSVDDGFIKCDLE